MDTRTVARYCPVKKEVPACSPLYMEYRMLVLGLLACPSCGGEEPS